MHWRNPQRGFTLIEIMLAIAILALLISIAVVSYNSYQEKSKIVAHALPVARACALEAITHCLSGRLTEQETITMNVTSFPNCHNMTTSFGNLTIDITGFITCEPTGHVSDCTVIGRLANIQNYQAKCIASDRELKCNIVSTN